MGTAHRYDADCCIRCPNCFLWGCSLTTTLIVHITSSSPSCRTISLYCIQLFHRLLLVPKAIRTSRLPRRNNNNNWFYGLLQEGKRKCGSVDSSTNRFCVPVVCVVRHYALAVFKTRKGTFSWRFSSQSCWRSYRARFILYSTSFSIRTSDTSLVLLLSSLLSPRRKEKISHGCGRRF